MARAWPSLALGAVLLALLSALPPTGVTAGPDVPATKGAIAERIARLMDERRFDEAEALARADALELERRFGAFSPEAAAALGRLVAISRRTRAAEPRTVLPDARRLVDVRERVHGVDSREAATARRILAQALVACGEYELARAELVAALAVLERPEHTSSTAAGQARLLLGSIEMSVHEYGRARHTLETAERELDRTAVRDQRLLGAILVRRAELEYSVGDLAAAESFLRHALDSERGVFRPGHPRIGKTEYGLAVVLSRRGATAEALAAAGRALAIHERAWGESDPRIVRALVQHAHLLTATGRVSEAESEFERARAILDRDPVRQPLELLSVTDGVALVRWIAGDDAAAFAAALQVERWSRDRFRALIQGFAERDALFESDRRATGLDLALSALAERGSAVAASGGYEDAAWTEVLRSRAMVLDEIGARHRLTFTTDDAAIRGAAERLQGARIAVARALVRDDEPTDDREDTLSRALERRGRAERELASASRRARDEEHRRQADVERIRHALPHDAALVAYVTFARLPRTAGLPARPEYAAFVLPADGGATRFVPLGAAADVDAAVAVWYAAAAVDPRARTRDGRPDPYVEVAGRLREMIWDPLEGSLGGAARVLIVPAAALHLVNLATLPDTAGEYLLDSGPAFQSLSAERDLLRVDDGRRDNSGLLAVLGPDFDAAEGADGVSSSAAAAARGAGHPCSTEIPGPFVPLPGARGSAAWVADVTERSGESTLRLTGAAADEATFKREAPGRRAIHVATHAFQVEAPCVDGPASGLSGLALAGANRALAGRFAGGSDDGILTAEEIMSLDLGGVELVSLAACDSAIGPLVSGEGMLGLRRAFEVAGARTLVTALWPVEDDTARVWMSEFYRSRFDGLSTAAAARGAAQSVARTTSRARDPYFWGGFVATGDGRFLTLRSKGTTN